MKAFAKKTVLLGLWWEVSLEDEKQQQNARSEAATWPKSQATSLMTAPIPLLLEQVGNSVSQVVVQVSDKRYSPLFYISLAAQ